MKVWIPFAVLAASYFLSFFSDEARQRRKKAQQVCESDLGYLCWLVFALLSLTSLPLGSTLEHLRKINWIKQKLTNKKFTNKKFIEIWVLFWAITNLLLVISWRESTAWVTLIALLRLSDLFYIFFHSFIFGPNPAPPLRALILLLVHYAEIIAGFALIYLGLQHIAHCELFTSLSNGGKPAFQHLTGIGALYFSFVTGSTIGFGDITLQAALISSNPPGWLVLAGLAIIAEIFCILVITLFGVSRIFTPWIPPLGSEPLIAP